MRELRHPGARTKLILAAVFTLVFALGASAHAAEYGTVNIKTPTEIGGTVVQPGNYMVRKIDVNGGTAIEFVREFREPTVLNEYGPDAQLVINGSQRDEVVARVSACRQALSAEARHTHLQLAPDASSAVGLEIRGDDTGYLFASPHAGAMAAPGEAGCAP